MREKIATLGPLASAFEHFCQITDTFAAGLFRCYDVEGLPRTNNELEHCFGVARVHERRATGRPVAIPGVVVRGSVRVRNCDPAIISAGAICGGSYSSARKLVASNFAFEKTRLPIYLPLKLACSSEVCRSALFFVQGSWSDRQGRHTYLSTKSDYVKSGSGILL